MTRPEPRTTPTASALVEYRTLIAAALSELASLEPLMAALVDTRNPSRGFLTVDAVAAQDELTAAERWDRRVANQAGMPASHGDSPAPAAIGAVSLIDEIHRELAQLITDTRRNLDAAGVCLYPAAIIPTNITALAREVVRVLAPINHPGRLRAIHTRIEALVVRARSLVDEERETPPDPHCPYCGLPTLVAYNTTGTIRCERDPHTRAHQQCICTDPLCPCHTSPYGWRCNNPACECNTRNQRHRHEWHRALGHKRWSWSDLRAAQNRATWSPDPETTT